MRDVNRAAPSARNQPIAGRLRTSGATDAIALAAWAGLIVGAHFWANELIESRGGIGLGAPPLFGAWDLQLDAGILGAAAVAALGILYGPRLAERLAWRPLLWAAFGGTLAWALALALSAGSSGLFDPLASPFEYLAGVPFVDSPGDYLDNFTRDLDPYPVHVRSHPPGLVLGLWGLDQIGLGGPKPASILIVLIGASAVPAALIAARSIAGEESARRAAPFLVLAPAAIWLATSADALFMGVGAWAVAATVLALAADGGRSRRLAVAGGFLFGLCALLSYGLVLLAIIPLAVAAVDRRLEPLVVVGAIAALVICVPLIWGFWWFDGYEAVREEYETSVAKDRPYGYFVFGNLAAFGLATGPALAVALGRLRLQRAFILPLAGLVVVAVADLSGMSKAEVERIWLPFFPWVMLATAALPVRPTWIRPALLGAGAALAIAIEMGVEIPW